MPIRKSILNRAEQARYLAASQELQAAGLEVDVPEEWLHRAHFLDVAVAGGPASSAVDLPNGGVGYAIYVRLVAMRRGLILPHYRITTEWDGQISLLHFDERGPICKLGWLSYSRNEVLNQHFDNSLRFHYRGEMIEGTILAMGLQSIPAAYRTGARIPLQLTFGDPFGHEITVEAELYHERTAEKCAFAPYEPFRPGKTPEASVSEDMPLPRRQHLGTHSPEECE